MTSAVPSCMSIVLPTRSNVTCRIPQRSPRHDLLERSGLMVSAFGTTVSLAFGRWMLALMLGMVVLGFFSRLTGRRRAERKVQPADPAWIYLAASAASVVEVALLVEATDLPVRFYQEGFAFGHWAIVVLALVAAFWLQLRALRAWATRARQQRTAE